MRIQVGHARSSHSVNGGKGKHNRHSSPADRKAAQLSLKIHQQERRHESKKVKQHAPAAQMNPGDLQMQVHHLMARMRNH